jgi:hypothetical protein
VRGGEDDLFLGDDGVDVVDVAGNVALQEVIRLAVAQTFDGGPEFVGRV